MLGSHEGNAYSKNMRFHRSCPTLGCALRTLPENDTDFFGKQAANFLLGCVAFCLSNCYIYVNDRSVTCDKRRYHQNGL